MIILNRADQRRQMGHGVFQVKLTFPGVNISPEKDLGLLNLGRFDHAVLKPGAFIAMHPHQNDEILSLLRSGTMLHKDSTGKVIAITKNHLMMMNAGKGIYHEESIPSDKYKEEVEMLQIFIRPERINEEPLVQFADLPDGKLNWWQLIAAHKNTRAPLIIRGDINVYVITLETFNVSLPPSPFSETTFLVYVFEGNINDQNGNVFTKGDSIIITEQEHLSFNATGKAVLVAFVMNSKAKYTREGMFSGIN